jgi:hypothetical protein
MGGSWRVSGLDFMTHIICLLTLNWYKGKYFQKTQVKRVLDRVETYSGNYKYSGIEVKGMHKAILENTTESTL